MLLISYVPKFKLAFMRNSFSYKCAQLWKKFPEDAKAADNVRCTTCVGHLGWLFKLNPHPRHQHRTNEVQKAETVLSAVSYIYIYIFYSYNFL